MTGFTKGNGTNGVSHVGTNLGYLLIGGGIGATLALLFAPKKGSELRHDISEITLKGYDETLDLARKLKDQSSDLYKALMEKKDDVYDFAASKLARVENVADDAAKNAGNAADKGLKKASNVIDGKSSGRINASDSF